MDNLSSPPFALVTFRHVKAWFTHLLDRRQITPCLDSKLLSIFMNQTFQILIFTPANDHFISVWKLQDHYVSYTSDSINFIHQCIKEIWVFNKTITFNIQKVDVDNRVTATQALPELCSDMLKLLAEWLTMQTLISWLLKEKFDLGVHCLLRHFCPNI